MTFAPAAWLPNRHAMTIVANLARLPRPTPFRRERWELPDGDFVDVDRLDPPGPANPDRPLVVVCHGLEGSSRAGYVVGLCRELAARGLASLALNFRGCSGELNRRARMYHAGETGDVAHLVERLASERPGRRLALAGFSLGGSVVVNYLAEKSTNVRSGIWGAAAMSVPFDLAACAVALDGPGVFARLYRERFLRQMRKKATAKARRFPVELPPAVLARARAARTLYEFDDAVTGPLHGFSGAEDYWARASSGPKLPSVAAPLFLLSAEDDPFIPADSLPRELARANPHVELEITAAGGHVAFVAGPPWAPRRWGEARLAAVLHAWLQQPPRRG